MDDTKLVSDEVQMMINRMQDFPDEFLSKDWQPSELEAWELEPWHGARWKNICAVLFKSGAEILFTKADRKALRRAYKELVRRRVREAIMVEIVSGPKLNDEPGQLNLPYMPFPQSRIRASDQQKMDAVKTLYEEYKEKTRLAMKSK